VAKWNAVKNKVIDLRRAKKAALNRVFAVSEALYSRRSVALNPLRYVDTTEASLSRSIYGLPRQVREILDRYYGGGQSETEIARILGITPQSVHTQRKRGLAKARVVFLKREYGPPAQWHKLRSADEPKRGE